MMAKPKAIIAVSAFFGVLALGAGPIAEQGTGGGADANPAIKALIEARIEVAKQVYESMQPAQGASLEEMADWSRRWMDEQIRLDPGAAKRLAAIQAHLDRTKSLEAIAEQRRQAARGTLADALKVKYHRLEAELMLEEIRIIKPGPPLPRPVTRP